MAFVPYRKCEAMLLMVLFGLMLLMMENAVDAQPRDRQLPDPGRPQQRTGDRTGPPDPPPIPPYDPNVCAGYCVNVPPATWGFVSVPY
jgi:hypothetical protein